VVSVWAAISDTAAVNRRRPVSASRRHADDVLANLQNEQALLEATVLDVGLVRGVLHGPTSCLSGRCLTGLIGDEPDSNFVDSRLRPRSWTGSPGLYESSGRAVNRCAIGCRPAMSSKSFGDNMCQLYESARPTGWAWCDSHQHRRPVNSWLRRVRTKPVERRAHQPTQGR